MAEIRNRTDINKLVVSFYAKVRQDKLLGPIFNRAIPEGKWENHFQKLTDFWETNLFGVRKFKGSPTLAHIKVDQEEGHQISQLHFQRWLELWFGTINDMFSGEKALRAKEGARRMGTGQFIAIFQARG